MLALNCSELLAIVVCLAFSNTLVVCPAIYLFACRLWWGGYLIFTHPNLYVFNDFLISNFAILFSLFGLGAAFQDISDRKETERSASRIFYLLDRQSKIDPMSEEGKVLDTSVARTRKKSIKKKKSTKSIHANDGDEIHTEVSGSEEKPLSSKSTGSKQKKKKKSSKKEEAATEDVAVVDNEDKPKKPKSAKKKKSKKKGKPADPPEAGTDGGDEAE